MNFIHKIGSALRSAFKTFCGFVAIIATFIWKVIRTACRLEKIPMFLATTGAYNLSMATLFMFLGAPFMASFVAWALPSLFIGAAFTIGWSIGEAVDASCADNAAAQAKRVEKINPELALAIKAQQIRIR